METVVYADLFFLINFSMDFLCLFLTSKILSRKFNLLRCLSAAIFGGIYADLSLFIPLFGLYSIVIDAAAGIILCTIAFFSRREWKRLPLITLVYIAVSMALGGSMTALFNLFNKTDIFDFLQNSDGDGISVWLFAALAAVSAIITLLGANGFKRRMSVKEAEVELTYGNKSVRLFAMTDSGNLLCDPISGKPCIIVDVKAISPILPQAVKNAARSPSDTSLLDSILQKDKRRIVLVPTLTASGESILLGIRLDCIRIIDKERSYVADAIVALSSASISANEKKALIPSCLMSG